MHGMMSSTPTLLRHHGKHLHHKECHFRILMLSGLLIQFIQLRTALLRFSHTISAITPGTRSNIKTHLRNRGKHPPQLVCHYLAPTLNIPRIQSIQLKIVPLKSFHITKEITLGTPSNTKTLLRSLGSLQHPLVCHWPVLIWLKRFTQPRIVNLKFFHTTNVTMPGIPNNTRIPPKKHGKHQHQLVCH